MKRSVIFTAFVLFFLISQISLISCLDLSVSEREISSVAIIELNKPALFELEISNNQENAETLSIYSLAGVNLKPSEPFLLAGNSTKTVLLEVYPKKIPGYISFEYKLKNSQNEIQTDELAINIVNLKDAFTFYVDNINPSSEKATVHFNNKAGTDLGEVSADFSSVFFEDSQKFDLSAKQEKTFEIPISQNKLRELLAGPYIAKANIEIDDEKAEISSVFRFTEKEGVTTTETEEGFLLRRHEILKENNGNLEADVEVIIKENLFADLFTTFNIAPTNEDRIGINKFYIFEKTLLPSGNLRVVAKTNWWFLILIIVGIIVFSRMIYRHTKLKLTLLKRVSFVKTKGGELALKVSLIVKARDFVEKIKVVDRLPAMVKLYDRYGTIVPDRIDEKNKRLEWNFENLNKGEERVLSYIIYSKIGVFGKFELPEAEVLYEHQGKIKDATSNRAFFVNEPAQRKIPVKKDPRDFRQFD